MTQTPVASPATEKQVEFVRSLIAQKIAKFEQYRDNPPASYKPGEIGTKQIIVWIGLLKAIDISKMTMDDASFFIQAFKVGTPNNLWRRLRRLEQFGCVAYCQEHAETFEKEAPMAATWSLAR